MEMISSLECIGLDESRLVKLFATDFLADSDAAAALNLLVNKALNDGFSFDIASAYRSFSRQCAIFDAKWNGLRPVLDEREQPIDISNLSAAEKVAVICCFSAIPGFSRHHFGTDFDIYSKSLLPVGEKLKLTAYEYEKDSYFYPLGLWLTENLNSFGFIRPYSGKNMGYEPWHISYEEKAQKYLNAFSFDAAVAVLLKTSYPWAKPCVDFAKNNYKKMLGIIC